MIPVNQNKKPLIKWEKYQKTPATIAEVNEWFSNFQSLNIAILTGEISNLLVVDTDSQESTEQIEELIGENFITPISQTPSGGRHYFFTHEEGFSNRARVRGEIDVRTTGGYVVVPPSINGNGKGWKWIIDLKTEINCIPDALRIFLSISATGYGFNPTLIPTPHNPSHPNTYPRERQNNAKTMPININLNEGQRDESLFHIANCLVRGGMELVDIEYLLDIYGDYCNPPFPKNELAVKIKSAIRRSETRTRNIAEEVREFILTTSGHFLTTEVHNGLQVTTRNDKKAVTMALLRMVSDGILEKHGQKNGCFRKIENDEEELNFLEETIIEYPVKIPFGLSDLCKLYRKNIVIVAGSKSAGKTAFLLNIAFRNQDIRPVIYITSEMAHEEWTERITQLGYAKKDIRFKSLIRSGNFHDKVTNEDKIFLIDFLEIHENFWEIAKYIRMIHDKLRDGVAFIAIQKKRGLELARGQDFSMEKARLYLSLDYQEYQGGCTKLTIVDAKAPKHGMQIRGAYKRIKINARKMESLDQEWIID